MNNVMSSILNTPLLLIISIRSLLTSWKLVETGGNYWMHLYFTWFHTTPFNWTILIELWRHRVLRRGRLLSDGGRGQQVCRGLALRPDPLDAVPLRQRRRDESSTNQEVIQIWNKTSIGHVSRHQHCSSLAYECTKNYINISLRNSALRRV